MPKKSIPGYIISLFLTIFLLAANQSFSQSLPEPKPDLCDGIYITGKHRLSPILGNPGNTWYTYEFEFAYSCEEEIMVMHSELIDYEIDEAYRESVLDPNSRLHGTTIHVRRSRFWKVDSSKSIHDGISFYAFEEFPEIESHYRSVDLSGNPESERSITSLPLFGARYEIDYLGASNFSILEETEDKIVEQSDITHSAYDEYDAKLKITKDKESGTIDLSELTINDHPKFTVFKTAELETFVDFSDSENYFSDITVTKNPEKINEMIEKFNQMSEETPQTNDKIWEVIIHDRTKKPTQTTRIDRYGEVTEMEFKPLNEMSTIKIRE